MVENTQDTAQTQPEQEYIYALDVGTRSIIGMLGTVEGSRVQICAVEKHLHTRRVMMDGQIEDIGQVAEAIREVTRKLERTAGCRLTRACVAAAGRALRTEPGHSELTLPAPGPVTEQQIAQLEAAAVAEAEQALHQAEEDGTRLFLVGYTAVRYCLDGYPLANLLGHTGQVLSTDVVATFLPSGVVDSLYAALRMAGLQVGSLTLEPIAALNAAIPAELRLLNLCLVDIGAGTSDIALCRDGSVVGYTMATVAGDEMTETLMREYLVDYDTAEAMKAGLSTGEELTFTNILGLEQTCAVSAVEKVLSPAIDLLSGEIAKRVQELNGGAPSALFLAGGGSKLPTLREKVAAALAMDPNRVAVAGGHFKRTVWSEDISLDDPEYTTPLGIAVSAGLGLVSDNCRVTLNGTPAKLFRSGSLTVMELLMMNGYTYSDLLGRNGKPLVLQVDGQRRVFHGEPAQPAQLLLNGAEATHTAVVHAGDQVEFTPAVRGADCILTAEELARRLRVPFLLVDGRTLAPEEEVANGAFVTLPGSVQRAEENDPPPQPISQPEPERSAPLQPEPKPQPQAEAPVVAEDPAPSVQGGGENGCSVLLNGKPVTLTDKDPGMPYFVMDLLERTGIDFRQAQGPVFLKVNGMDCQFQQILNQGDRVEIGIQDKAVTL